MGINLAEFDRGEDRQRALVDLSAWAAGGFTLQPAEGSSAHRLREAAANKNILRILAPKGSSPVFPPIVEAINPFVIQHDWASAFKNAQDFDAGDFQLPFEDCWFEFRISGRRTFTSVRERKGVKSIMMFIEVGKLWAMPIEPFLLEDGHWKPMYADSGNPINPLVPVLALQIKAACVSLEAEIAVGEKVEAPEKLNAARERRGQEPMPDYYVVRLNRRPRSTQLDGDGTTKKRLHFRRGHWRHLSEDRNTWVRWCLVGDPDLGFIEHEYRL